MTDLDNLRERLTALILGRTAPTAAQAIIDEFELTVETTKTTYPAPGAERFEHATVSFDHDRNEWQATGEHGADVSDPYNEWINSLPVESRIVGKWVKQ